MQYVYAAAQTGHGGALDDPTAVDYGVVAHLMFGLAVSPPAPRPPRPSWAAGPDPVPQAEGLPDAHAGRAAPPLIMCHRRSPTGHDRQCLVSAAGRRVKLSALG